MNNIQELIIRVHVPHVAHNAQNVFSNYFTQRAPLLVHCQSDSMWRTMPQRITVIMIGNVYQLWLTNFFTKYSTTNLYRPAHNLPPRCL